MGGIDTDFEQSTSATKEDAVKSAAQMALKLYLKSQLGGGSSGGNSGASGLLGMASKFL